MPVSLCFELLLFGVILLWFTRRQRMGKVFVTCSLVFFAVATYGPFSRWMLEPLEFRYPPIMTPAELPHVKWVVVLSGGHTTDHRLPPTSRLNPETMTRLVEGIRLYRSKPGSRLLLSGGVVFGSSPSAETLRDVALELGIPDKDIVVENKSRDTAHEALLVQKIVGKDPFVLVTSASHMPRSVALFRKQGMNPIPAPAGYLTKEDSKKRISPGILFPDAYEFVRLEGAIHEHLGILWAKMRGQL